jgi:predicted ester cyclase
MSGQANSARTTEANKEMLRRGWIAYATFDEAAFLKDLDPNWRDHDLAGNVTDTPERALALMRRMRVGFPDQRIEIREIFGEGDLVATLVTLTATHTGTYGDLEPTGREIRSTTLSIHRVVDGRVAESWSISDSPGPYEQITGHPPPEDVPLQTED